MTDDVGFGTSSTLMEKTLPLILQWDETFDIGSDTGTPVDDNDYQIPFTFTGKLNEVVLKISPPVLTDAEKKQLQEQVVKNSMAS